MDEFQAIVLQAKDDVYTLLQGGNFSQILGQGYDFSELRSYEHSDDIRYISWINSAKSNELYVKKMHEERELLVHVSMLVDGRMIIGKKHELMTQVLATLAYSAVYTNNLFEASFSLGNGVKHFEPFKNSEHIEPLLNAFNQLNPLGLALDYEQLSTKLLECQAQKSLFFLVGDFLDEIDLSVLAQKHELCVIMVRDRWEENPVVDGNSELINPLTDRLMAKSVSKKALKHYVQELQEHDEKLYAHFHEYNIKYTKIYGALEVVEKLEQLFYS